MDELRGFEQTLSLRLPDLEFEDGIGDINMFDIIRVIVTKGHAQGKQYVYNCIMFLSPWPYSPCSLVWSVPFPHVGVEGDCADSDQSLRVRTNPHCP